MIDEVKFSDLEGLVLSKIEVSPDRDEIIFTTAETPPTKYRMYHSQDCCESVTIEDITGDLKNLIGEVILVAEEAESDKRPDDLPKPEYEDDSQTWTFYKLATFKGWVDIRWYGSSNGYYGEGVDFVKMGGND